ncbi:MFS transporter [Streptosporangium subroseum]|uniref:MFS transporter n=1 Tax=Streptosporangium subroseum TaxID=106412 RepID=UPI00308B9682|nr:MFS transporter [Streptosporangium subroseum]
MNAKKLALLAFSQLIVALDYNIVYVALPDIGRELDFSAQTLQWVVSGYAVGFGGFLLLGGRAVDRLGARRMFILGLALYGISSLAGGLAADPGLLVAARVIQGLGGALLTPATLALIYSGFAEGPTRNRALGAWGTAGSAGLAAGALLGGVLTAAGGWQWVFYVNVPLTLIAIIAASRLLPPDPSHERGSFDVLGALLATAGSTLMVLGLVSGPEAGWVTLRGLGSLAAGIVLIGVFLLVEARSSEPLAPPRLLGNRNLATSMLVILFFQSALGGGYYLFTMYLQPVLGYSALQAGLAFLPLTLLSMVSAAKLAPALLGRWGVRTTLIVGMLGSGIGMVVLYAGMSADGSFWALVPGTVIWGLAGGFTFVAMFAAAGSGVALTEQGVASGLATTAQQIGGAIGLAVIIAVANAGAPGVDGLRTAGWVAAAASIAGALIALTLRRQPTAAAQETTISPEGINR